MTMHKALNLRDDTDSTYQEKEKNLPALSQDCIDASI